MIIHSSGQRRGRSRMRQVPTPSIAKTGDGVYEQSVERFNRMRLSTASWIKLMDSLKQPGNCCDVDWGLRAGVMTGVINLRD